MSYKLAVYFLFWPIFNLMIWIMAILWKGCKPDNFQSHNSLKLSLLKLFEALVWILLIVNLPLSQTLLILVCVRQNWMTRLILCEGGLSSFNPKGLHRIYAPKRWGQKIWLWGLDFKSWGGGGWEGEDLRSGGGLNSQRGRWELSSQRGLTRFLRDNMFFCKRVISVATLLLIIHITSIF